MGIFDDIADGFEKVASTVADAVTSPLDTLSDLADHGLGVIGDMRGAAALLPVGFPALALMGELDDITNNPIMETLVDTVGNAPQFMGGIPNIGQVLGDASEAPSSFALGSLDRILSRRSGAEQIALNPQPLPPSPVDMRTFFDIMNRGGGERALNPQPLPPSPVDMSTFFDIMNRGGGERALNPQPLPPSPELLAHAELGRILRRMNRGGERALNPQPLPPSPVDLRSEIAQRHGAGERALNPQPLPPSPVDLRNEFAQRRGAGERTLNPQPLPPSPKDLFGALNRGEQVSLNPQPLPPAPEELARVIDSPKRGPEVFLNPQPLPPAPEELFATRRFDEVALNPQPLPPLPVNQLLNVSQMKLQQLSKASMAKARMI